MLKLAVISLFLAAVSAGYVAPLTYNAAPAVYGATFGYAAHAAPLAIAHAPLVAHAPVATSYSNTYRTVNKPVVATYTAPAVATIAAAPVAAVAHAPVAYSAPLTYVYHRR